MKTTNRGEKNDLNFFIPSRGPLSWRESLADPEKQWKRGIQLMN